MTETGHRPPSSVPEGATGPTLDVDIRLPLDRFSLQLAFATTAHVTGLFGPSGAGKTSVLESIAGLRRPLGRIAFGEEVWLDSESGVFVPPEARRIGYVPQEGLLFPHLDVRGNLLAGVAAREEPPDGAPDRFKETCEMLELGSLLSRDVKDLSAGERQRVALGRAVCSGPELLLLDEPLGSLDHPLRNRILPFLRQLRDELEIPMVYVSHDPTEVLALCDELVVVEEGRLRARGKPSDLLADPLVWSLAEEDGFENVLPAIVLSSQEAEGGRVSLAEGVVLRVPGLAELPGQQVLVSLPAQQILIAVDRPVGLSARNCLPATVTSVRPAGRLVLVGVRLAPGLPEVMAELVQEACDELDLRAGKDVFLVIKTTGITVLSTGVNRGPEAA